MEENKKAKKVPTILLIALIAALFIGVELIFEGLGTISPPDPDNWPTSSVSSSVPADISHSEDDAPSFCPSCGHALHEGFEWGRFCPYCGEQVI